MPLVLPNFPMKVTFGELGGEGLSCMAYWILVPQPGIELGPPALEVWCPNHWTTREFTFL